MGQIRNLVVFVLTIIYRSVSCEQNVETVVVLADGAEGDTLKEIQSVTRHNLICSREIIKEIFNSPATELNETIRHKSHIFVDSLLDIKDTFVNNIEMLNAAKVFPIYFKSIESAAKANDIINYSTNGKVTKILGDDDFKLAVLLMTDVASMKASWQSPFSHLFTRREIFYSNERVPIGYVNMMEQTGSFKFNNIPAIDALALELPLINRASMIILLPNKGPASNLFLSMRNISMTSIIRLLNSNRQLVNVKIPRFNLSTEVDNMLELLYDMGIYKMFSPRFAEFRNISNYRVYVPMIKNKNDIEVTEVGVSANIAPENIVRKEDKFSVSFNRPFAYLIVDKTTNVILFAGIFSKPSF